MAGSSRQGQPARQGRLQASQAAHRHPLELPQQNTELWRLVAHAGPSWHLDLESPKLMQTFASDESGVSLNRNH